MNKKLMARVIVFFLLVSGLLYKCYKVLGYYDNVHSSAVFEQFYGLPRNSVDVVWLGASSVQEFIIAPVMFENTGLAIYPLAVGNEPFMSTKYLIEECERKQNPQLYLVDIRHLAYSVGDDTYVRRITDNMKFSKNRIDAIEYMTNNLEKYNAQNVLDAKIDYLFSLTKYHTRWDELHREDFTNDDNAFFGYWIKTSNQEFDAESVKARFDTKAIPVSEESTQYLSDLLDYCDSFDKKVIFTRTPNCLDVEMFGKYNYIQGVIEDRGYEVWDINLEVDKIGLDYKSDFADPMHTNVYGAQKVSKYYAKKIIDNYGFSDHRGDIKYKAWDEMTANFHEKLMENELRSCQDFSNYLDKLNMLDKNDYSIYIAIREIQGYNLTPEHINKLESLGFSKVSILLEHVYHSFVGAIVNGKLVCSKIGENNDPDLMKAESVYYDGIINNQKVSLSSKVWKNGDLASIKMGEREYSKNSRGFNIVVVDNKDGYVLDSVGFDTHSEGIPCKR